jgi:probable O-glycosylation ligase (exosortase A-associated)
VSLHATAEWWRPESLSVRDQPTPAHLDFALKTDDSPLAYRALMAFLFILLISPQSIFPVLAPLRLAMLAVAVAVIAHIAGRLRYGRPVMVFTRETVIVIWLLGWAILTVPFSLWPGGSISFLLEFYLKTLVLFWLLGNIINTLPRLRTMTWGLCLMSVPIALTGVKNYLAGVFIEGSGRVDGYSAPLTGNPNDLALMLNLLIPVCIALLLSNKRPVIRLVLTAIIALNVLAVFMTFSRAGFLTLAVILMAYTWMLRKRPERRWVYLVLFIVMVAIPFAPSNYVNRINTITNIEDDQSGSAQVRWSDMALATKYVVKHPIAGAGLGMNIVAMDQERGSYGTAIHNVYLQYAVELGLPGLILFVLLLKTSIKNVSTIQKQLLQDHKPAEIFYLAEGIRISLIAFAVAAMFHPVGYHFYFYIIAGLSAAIKTIYDAGIRSHTDNAITRAV